MDDMFAKEWFGKLALKQMRKAGELPENFRLYSAGWLETGGPPETWTTIEVKGAEFREATKGPRKGRLCIMIPGTSRTTHVSINDRPKQWK